MQKRSFAALTLRERTVRNDGARVVLRVMLETAQAAGVVFDPILIDTLPAQNELTPSRLSG